MAEPVSNADELPWSLSDDGFQYRYNAARDPRYAWQARHPMHNDRIGEGHDPAQAVWCAATGLVYAIWKAERLQADAEARLAAAEAERDALKAERAEWVKAMNELFGETLRSAYGDPEEPEAWDLGAEGREGDILMETPAEAVRELVRAWASLSERADERDAALAAAEAEVARLRDAMRLVRRGGCLRGFLCDREQVEAKCSPCIARAALAEPRTEEGKPDVCPHAAPFVYCPECVVSPCPIGLGRAVRPPTRPTVADSSDRDCLICGKPKSYHGGIELLCPMYATYRPAPLYPRPWSTAEDLGALPCGAIVLDRDQDAHEKCSGGEWYTLTWRGPTKSAEVAVHGPGRIIYVPEATT